MNYLKISIALISTFATAFLSAAQETSSIFNYSRCDRNPVTAAMAGASLTNTEVLSWSALSNPSAALFSSQAGEISGSWQSWAPNSAATSAYSFSAGYNGGRFLFSIAGTYSSDKPYDVIASDGLAKGTFTPNGLYAGLGLAFKIVEKLSLGVNVKYLSSTLSENTSYQGFGAGLMLTYHQDCLTAAAGIQDIGPQVKGRGDSAYSLPTSAAASVSYSMPLEQAHALHLEVDGHYYLSGGFSAALAAQYSFKNLLFARAGYHLASGAAPIAPHASVGLGLRLKALELDFAYLTANQYIGSSMVAGLSISF